jgi:hypothetical protein
MASKDPKSEPQMGLFATLDEDHWKGLPSFDHWDRSPHHSVLLHFANEEEIAEFYRMIGQQRTKHKSLWFKQPEIGSGIDKVWVEEHNIGQVGAQQVAAPVAQSISDEARDAAAAQAIAAIETQEREIAVAEAEMELDEEDPDYVPF